MPLFFAGNSTVKDIESVSKLVPYRWAEIRQQLWRVANQCSHAWWDVDFAYFRYLNFQPRSKRIFTRLLNGFGFRHAAPLASNKIQKRKYVAHCLLWRRSQLESSPPISGELHTLWGFETNHITSLSWSVASQRVILKHMNSESPNRTYALHQDWLHVVKTFTAPLPLKSRNRNTYRQAIPNK